MRQKSIRAQKVLHPKRRGRRPGAKPDGMQRLRLLMFLVAAAAFVVAGAVGIVGWLLLREAPENASVAQNDSVQVEERILPALRKMLEDARFESDRYRACCF